MARLQQEPGDNTVVTATAKHGAKPDNSDGKEAANHNRAEQEMQPFNIFLLALDRCKNGFYRFRTRIAPKPGCFCKLAGAPPTCTLLSHA
jgi:hypothetical protein